MPFVETSIVTAPGRSIDGDSHVRRVDDMKTAATALLSPKRHDKVLGYDCTKLVPVIVTIVPPDKADTAGETDLTETAGS